VPSALIVNPHASRVTPELVGAVERELGDVETLLTERPRHATKLAAGVDAERIYVFSGDGGYNEVVNGIEGEVALGFIPGGGTSVMPRALGLPRDPVECARALRRSLRTRTISLGRAMFSTSNPSTGSPTGRRFLFSAGVGLDAELVREIDRMGREGGRRPGDVTWAATLARLLLARRGRLRPALTVLGRGRAAFALVANCDPYTYAGALALHVAPEARFELGLDLVAPRELHPSRLPFAAFSLLVRPTHTRARWVIHLHDADDIRLECDGPTPLQVDGEDLGDVTDVSFEAERAALSVVVA
jgi:diacylglycerol kinase family enzyme